MSAPHPHRLIPVDEFSLADIEAIRLILSGDSVIDWHRLSYTSEREVAEAIAAQEFRLDDQADCERLESLKQQAIGYLHRQFNFPVPKAVASATTAELMLMASGQGHRQVCACSILKCMHIIHHLDGRELLFVLPMSDQEVFQAVEEKVYRVIGNMLAHAHPVIEFVGGRKNKDSLYTKLLSKQDTIAAQIYDKLRFRIVVRHVHDILPILHYLTRTLFPFSYIVPGQSENSVFDFQEFCAGFPNLREQYPQLQADTDGGFSRSPNQFSAESYRVLHFVVDMPVRLPTRILERAPPNAIDKYGRIIFVICEFQIVDHETDTKNELGEASHAAYKERQKLAVMRRLRLNPRPSK